MRAGATDGHRRLTMYARAIDDAAAELRELRATEREDLGLALVALAASLVATHAAPSIALPLFLGAVWVAVLGLRATIRRFELVQQLWGDRDAYAIREVRKRAEREATLARRRSPRRGSALSSKAPPTNVSSRSSRSFGPWSRSSRTPVSRSTPWPPSSARSS